MKFNVWKIVGISLQILAGTLPVAAGGNENFSICRDGRAEVRIVVSGRASAAEKYAAKILADCLKKASGADYPVTGTRNPAGANILVGPDAADFHKTETASGNDGILLKSEGNDLILSGVRPRGTLYAVHTFLEDYIGFRFWCGRQKDENETAKLDIPAEIHIPARRANLSVPRISLRYTPQMEMREPFFGKNLNDPDWCVANKVIGRITKTEKAEYGGLLKTIGPIQSFWYWLPPEKWFSSHPEYYSEIDGVRNWKNPKAKIWVDRETQLCMSNPEVADRIAEEVLRKLKAAKGKITAVSIAPNDRNNPCQCAACREIYRREGAKSGALLLMLNRIAEKVGRFYPEVEFYTRAYMWYQDAPKQIRPAKKVVVWFVTQGMSLCDSYEVGQNRAVRDRLLRWGEICRESGSKLYVWDHGANWTHYLVPFPDIHRWQESFRLYHKLNVKGMWFLGTYSRPNMELAVMRN